MSDSNGISTNDPSILDAETKQLKEELAAEIKHKIEELGLQSEQAAQALRITRVELTAMMNGELDNFPAEQLEDMKIKLGLLGKGGTAGIRRGASVAGSERQETGNASPTTIPGQEESPAEHGPDVSGPM